LRAAPKIAYFRIRDFLFRSVLEHRKRWLAKKGLAFGRGDGRIGGPIRVRQINDGLGDVGPVDVAYQVTPKQKRAESPAQASQLLPQLVAEIFTGNLVLPIHQEGRAIDTTEFMAIPVRTRPGSVKKWREQNPGKTLITLPSKRDNKLLLYERTIVRGRGRPKKGEAPKTKERLRLRFLLTKHVGMKPTLQLYETWDEQVPFRDAAWKEAADKMQADLVKGDPRDFQ